MNSMIKIAIASTLVLAATSAFAALPDPSTNASDLVLVVQNNTTQATYVLDTGITINSLVGPTSATAKADTSTWTGIDKTIAASSTLSTFLTGSSSSGFSWGIQAAQFNGNAANATCNVVKGCIGIFSSANSTINITQVTGMTLGNLVTYANGTYNSLNAGVGLSPLKTASESATGPAYDGADQQKYGLFQINDLSAVGTPSELFALTGNGARQTESYNVGIVTLNADGSLQFKSNGGVTPPPVPLPAAVWLFGSGLMGLVGVSRRRKAAAAV